MHLSGRKVERRWHERDQAWSAEGGRGLRIPHYVEDRRPVASRKPAEALIAAGRKFSGRSHSLQLRARTYPQAPIVVCWIGCRPDTSRRNCDASYSRNVR
jgi:hypothetical protein